MTDYDIWLSRVRDQIELYWGCDLKKMDVPWRKYYNAGLNVSGACDQAIRDGLYTDPMTTDVR